MNFNQSVKELFSNLNAPALNIVCDETKTVISLFSVSGKEYEAGAKTSTQALTDFFKKYNIDFDDKNPFLPFEGSSSTIGIFENRIYKISHNVDTSPGVIFSPPKNVTDGDYLGAINSFK